jgi:hypothetical protein
MHWSRFDVAFPWIGGLAAVVLLVLLFGTDVLRSGSATSRWRDPVAMSWMATVAYLLHNVEEYAVDLLGLRMRFPMHSARASSSYHFQPAPFLRLSFWL